jgi:hypothetical protein
VSGKYLLVRIRGFTGWDGAEIPFTDELCAKLSAKQPKNANPAAAKKTRKIRNVVLVKAKNPEAAISEATKLATVIANTEKPKLNAASMKLLELPASKTPQAGVAGKKSGQSDDETPDMRNRVKWQPRKDWHLDGNELTELKDDGDNDNDDGGEDGPAPGSDALQIPSAKASTKPTEKGNATLQSANPQQARPTNTLPSATNSRPDPPRSLGNALTKPKGAAAKPQDITKAPLIFLPSSSSPPKPDSTKTQPPTLRPDDELSDLSDYKPPTPPEDLKQNSPLIKKEYPSDDDLPSDDDPDDDVRDGYTDDGDETNSGFGSLASSSSLPGRCYSPPPPPPPRPRAYSPFGCKTRPEWRE